MSTPQHEAGADPAALESDLPDVGSLDPAALAAIPDSALAAAVRRQLAGADEDYFAAFQNAM
ncbi:hypothetical protein V5P93_005363 [Actinokineospora auranticolor]|uniref:FXSXX-COOH protein n=1 Tax=Actinokineospora auranticolor TaxID=155976 RepID=A0A2S6GQY3_9PSEU|nr:hypothetical protein [Actinokineospora auranticolor]PPK67610.1 FXSXX-COOH protein [Actinokineospora auranticolor]